MVTKNWVERSGGLKPRPYRTTLISTRCEDWLNIHTLIVQFLAHKV